MGYQLVKHLESQQYNRKLFYLDQGAEDLPPIINFTDIQPGSEARSLTTGEKWILNTHFKWVYIKESGCGCCGGSSGAGGGNAGGDGSGNTPGGGTEVVDPDPVPGEEPTIEGITLSPLNITVGQGATVAFTAVVQGNAQLSRGVKWTIKGQRVSDTTITQDGILKIGEKETSKTITVRVTSEADESVYAQAVVSVDVNMEDPLAPMVTGIVLVPTDVEVILGRSVMFNTMVNGVNLSDFSAVYSVSGQSSTNTYIDQDGTLHVGADEQSKVLVVTAKAAADQRFFATATVSVTDSQHAVDQSTVTEVIVYPGACQIGCGYSQQFAAKVNGVNNPSQQVVWKLTGATSSDTRITPNGLVFVGEDEKSNMLVLTAYSQKTPEVYGEAIIDVVPAETPGVDEVTVDAIIITPDMVELEQGWQTVFKAVVIGKNNPSQAVTWSLTGNNVQTTYLTDDGVLTIGIGETAKSLQVRATSKQDTTKYNIAYVTIAAYDAGGDNGFTDVPATPLNTKYVRERTANGSAVWTPIEEEVEEPIPEPDPEIHSVEVSPNAVTVRPGSVITFAAIVNGSEELSKEVTWSISGQRDPNTKITSDGVLTIGADEDAMMIRVTARSIVDTSKYGTATISIDEEAPVLQQVTGFYLEPIEATVIKDHSLRFQAIVTGVNITNHDATFAVSGNQSPQTIITPEGVLYVDKEETSALLVITGTCAADPKFTDTSLVTVIPPELAEDEPVVTVIQLYPAYTQIGRGMSARFAVQLTGLNNPPASIIWDLTGASSLATHVSRDGVVYIGADEQLHEITLRATVSYDPTKFAESTINVVSEDTPGIDKTTVDAVIISPAAVESDPGHRITFKATVIGQNNPSQEVIWSLDGNLKAETTINQMGVLTIATDETARVLKITATSVADSTVKSTSYVTISKTQDTPETGIEDVPNDPLNMNYQRRIDENGRTYWVKYPEVDNDGQRYMRRYNQVTGEYEWEPYPEIPLDGKQYARQYNPETRTVEWVEVEASGGRPDAPINLGTVGTKAELDRFEIPADSIDGDFIFVESDESQNHCPAMYIVHTGPDGRKEFVLSMVFGRPAAPINLGTVGTKAELDEFEIPTNSMDGDFIYVENDETQGRCPTMYIVQTNEHGEKEFVLSMVFGRKPILGDKLDILYVLDNGVHSQLIKDIEVMTDFNTTEKRYELYKSPSAWHLVTELHKGFWKTIKEQGWFKAVFGMRREDGSVRGYVTAFTDDHEFEHYLTRDVNNPQPIRNTLAWTNTVQPGTLFTAGNETSLIQYRLNIEPTPEELTVFSQEAVDPGTTPGVTPWAMVIGQYSTLMNGEVVGPLANVTDNRGFVWVSEHEKFMIGSAGNGTQMFCYNIDDNNYFIFDVPNTVRDTTSPYRAFQMATDVHERYIFFYINNRDGVWIDRKTQEVKDIYWRPSGYDGLSDPGPLTKPSISPDGKYYMHTSTNEETPNFTSFSFDTGDIVTEGPVNGVTSSAICLDSNLVFTNDPSGLILTYNFDPVRGTLTERHRETPFATRYVVEFTSNGNQVLCVKVEAGDNCPLWFVYDVSQDTIVAQSSHNGRNEYCEQTNPQAKSCTYALPTSVGERYLLSFQDNSGGIILAYDGNNWTEVTIPFSGLGNDAHEYNQPVTMNNGDILITQREDGTPVGFNLVTMKEVELEDILDPGGDPHMVQIDSNHYGWCTSNGSQIIRVEADGTQKVILEIPEQQLIVFGFGNRVGGEGR